MDADKQPKNSRALGFALAVCVGLLFAACLLMENADVARLMGEGVK